MTAAEYQQQAASEQSEQIALFERAEAHFAEYPELRLMFAVPNGGSRHKVEAVNLKKSGVKPGVPDICLPIARRGYSALFIEMKKHDGRESREQTDWRESLNLHGNLAVVCKGQDDAWNCLMQYLGEPYAEVTFSK
jgi:dienelactone hydrolase